MDLTKVFLDSSLFPTPSRPLLEGGWDGLWTVVRRLQNKYRLSDRSSSFTDLTVDLEVL